MQKTNRFAEYDFNTVFPQEPAPSSPHNPPSASSAHPATSAYQSPDLSNALLEDLLNPSISALDLCAIHRLSLPALAELLESDQLRQARACIQRISEARTTLIEPEAKALALARTHDILKDKPTTPAHAETQRKTASALIRPGASPPRLPEKCSSAPTTLVHSTQTHQRTSTERATMSHTTSKSVRTLVTAVIGAAASMAHAQNVISYQGTLNDAGAPANGTYDMRFSVWNDPTSGPPDFQFGVTQTLFGVTVEDGLFNVLLNLADEAYETIDPRYLQIEVRQSGGAGYTELAPRSPLAFAPRSIFALQSSSASALDLPLSIAGPSDVPNGATLRLFNNDTSGAAFYADAPTWGILSFAGNTNPYPPVNVPAGLFGIGEATGTGGSSDAGSGILGVTNSGYAGEFRTFGSNNGVPLWAHTQGTNNSAIIEINNADSNSAALIVRSNSTRAAAYATHAIIESTAPGGNSTALRGENRGTSSFGIGVWGSQEGSGWGVYGTSADGGLGVYGSSSGAGGAGVYGVGSSSASAGFFIGDVTITGSLSKGSGTFRIDHPLDPANMYLSHSFVESPEMKNIYDGVATLDDTGSATVTMPSYFDALNTEFRYQLTCIGGYAPVYIAEEINERQFSIAGGKPGLKVSWQITGIRQDPFAIANPVRVEEEKSSQDKGRYLHPELYNQPKEKAIGYTAQPTNQQN